MALAPVMNAVPAPPVVQEVLAAQVVGFQRMLRERYPSIDVALVDAMFDEALADLASRAVIHTYLPLLASRRARTRLDRLVLEAAARPT